MNTNQTSNCPACTALRVVQCNKHRKAAPNARTLKQRAIADDVRAGMTIAAAEAKHGASGHVALGR